VLQDVPLAWVIRTRVAPMSLSSAIQTELREASGGLPVASVRTTEETLSRSMAAEDFNTLVLTIFGCSALLLATIGIYGVVAYAVTQRTHEIGIRIALGARPKDISLLVIYQGVGLALVGVFSGVVGAFVLTRLLKSFLYGVTTNDPLTFVLVPLLLTWVALLACYFPARRATKVDPMVALRHE
jgi:putative ABC transport system permease protein